MWMGVGDTVDVERTAHSRPVLIEKERRIITVVPRHV